MFKSDILFTGFYGYRNTGDDAFIEVASWGAKEVWKKDNNLFLCRNYDLPETVVSTKGYPVNIKRTYSIQANLLLNNTKSFIYAGGSTIHAELSSKNIRMKAVQKKQKGHDFNFGAIGVSIGPFKSIKDEKAVQVYLKQMDFLAVRDQSSFDFVNSIDNLSYEPINAFDLAALLPEIYNYDYSIENKKHHKTIGISVCQYESIQNGMSVEHELKRNSMLVDLIKVLDKKENIHFKFYIINGNDIIGDFRLTSETIVASQPKSYEIVPYNKVTHQTWTSIAECDFIISTRLHAAIFACFANTPFMLNEYHRKCQDFLTNVGYNEKYRLYNSEYDIEQKANQILQIINNQSEYLMPTKIDQMKELAKLNFTKINF